MDVVNVQQLKNVNSMLSMSIGNVDVCVMLVGNVLLILILNVDQCVISVGNSFSMSIVMVMQNVVKYIDDLYVVIVFDGVIGMMIGGVVVGVVDIDVVNVGQLKGSFMLLQMFILMVILNIMNLQNSVMGINGLLSMVVLNIVGLQVVDMCNVKYDGVSGFDLVMFVGFNGMMLYNVVDGKDLYDVVNVGQLNGGFVLFSMSVMNNFSMMFGNLSMLIISQIGNVMKNVVQYDDDVYGGVMFGGKGVMVLVGLYNVVDGVVVGDVVNVGQFGKVIDMFNQLIMIVGNQVMVNIGNIVVFQQDVLQWNLGFGVYDVSYGGYGLQLISNVVVGKSGMDVVNVDQLNVVIYDGMSQFDVFVVKYDDVSKQQVLFGVGNGGSLVCLINVVVGNVVVGSMDVVNGV